MRRLILCAVLFAPAAYAAPAPLPRRPGPGDLPPGRYLARWYGGAWETELAPGGAYRARMGGLAFAGTWEFDRGSRTFTVREGVEGSVPHATYRVVLDRRLRGRTQHGERLSLTRIGGR